MDYETRPPRRGLLPELSAQFRNHIARVEYVVFTRADCRLAWKIFSDIKLWPQFCDLYTGLRWQGTPWRPGSRLRMELKDPVNAVVDRVVTVCMPPNHLAWINHVLGYTMEQWIAFEPYSGGGTRVATWIEVTGAELSKRGGDDIRYLKTIVSTWFDNFSAECDRADDAIHADDIPSAAD